MIRLPSLDAMPSARILGMALVLAACAIPSRAQPVGAFDGSYAVEMGQDAGCRLTAQEVRPGWLRIQLDCNRGPPSYNVGTLDKIIPLRGNRAVYRDERLGECRIRFAFDSAGVSVVHQERGSGCGFGLGVYAGGKYHKVNDQPKFHERL